MADGKLIKHALNTLHRFYRILVSTRSQKLVPHDALIRKLEEKLSFPIINSYID